jgi:hypothetical protein
LAWVWPLTLALGVVAIRQRRRLARELANLIELRGQLDDRLNR